MPESPTLPSWQPHDEMPMPSEEALASGTLGPMDVPITSPREGRKRHVSIKILRLRKLKRLRSSHKLPVMPGLVHKAQKLRDMDEELLVSKNLCNLCGCKACKHLQRWSSTILPYRCTNVNCRLVFDAFTDLYEHQLDIHGGLDPRANRIVDDLYHQQQGTLAFPPSTVYIGQQYMCPSRPPKRWKSMKALHNEAETLYDRLWNYNRYYFQLPTTYCHGALQLSVQFPASSRGVYDGCPSVERGRNWLTSTDREDARLLHPFSLGDKVDAEPEFVLIDTKRDQEMYEELHGATEDDAVILVDSNEEEKLPPSGRCSTRENGRSSKRTATPAHRKTRKATATRSTSFRRQAGGHI
ncbi:uncharacterized protein KRP23_5727 [Phytophthora ramorum]|uniref:uncharacterized protein n=1 Tax=Phytophthora ramorum TaxID=164328 RepID=UPI003097DB62|nr:hypothetical protein KRP23_5727 [Phytophthora ramorum]